MKQFYVLMLALLLTGSGIIHGASAMTDEEESLMKKAQEMAEELGRPDWIRGIFTALEKTKTKPAKDSAKEEEYLNFSRVLMVFHNLIKDKTPTTDLKKDDLKELSSKISEEDFQQWVKAQEKAKEKSLLQEEAKKESLLTGLPEELILEVRSCKDLSGLQTLDIPSDFKLQNTDVCQRLSDQGDTLFNAEQFSVLYKQALFALTYQAPTDPREADPVALANQLRGLSFNITVNQALKGQVHPSDIEEVAQGYLPNKAHDLLETSSEELKKIMADSLSKDHNAKPEIKKIAALKKLLEEAATNKCYDESFLSKVSGYSSIEKDLGQFKTTEELALAEGLKRAMRDLINTMKNDKRPNTGLIPARDAIGKGVTGIIKRMQSGDKKQVVAIDSLTGKKQLTEAEKQAKRAKWLALSPEERAAREAKAHARQLAKK